MEREKKISAETESSLPEYLSMYEISGQDPITEHSFDRYTRDKIDNDEKIKNLVIVEEETKKLPLKEQIEEGLNHPNPEVQQVAASRIKDLLEAERISVVKQGLSHPNPEVQKIAAWMMRSSSQQLERNALIKETLTHPNPEVRQQAMIMVQSTPKSERDFLMSIFLQQVEKDLNHPNLAVQQTAVESLLSVPQAERSVLREIILQQIEQGLNHPNPEVQQMAAERIMFAPEFERGFLVEQGLNHPNPEVQQMAAERIMFAPEFERGFLVEQGLANPNWEVKKIAAEMVLRVLGVTEKNSLREIVLQQIEEGLQHLNPEVQKTAVMMIKNAPKAERCFLVKEVLLNNSNPEAQKTAAEMIRYVPEVERTILVQEGLQHVNPEVQKTAAEMIRYVPEVEITTLIQEGLDHLNPQVQQVAASMIGRAPEVEKEGILNRAISKGFGEYIIESRLYRRSTVTKERFSRAKFDKSGSQTFLLGGELKDKTIIREITPTAFMGWQKIYENWELWQQAGFDYVPVEPIQSFSLNKNGLIRVYTGVLDLSLGDWNQITPKFASEFDAQVIKIETVLINQKIKHGHIHWNNFCLRFFRDQDGKPDFNRVPRLYLIDFDQAASFGE